MLFLGRHRRLWLSPLSRGEARRWLMAALGLVLGWTAPQLWAAAPDVEFKPIRSLDAPRWAGTPLARELTRHAGKPVLINFWGSWCAPCREELPALQKVSTRWAANGLAVVTVAVADKRKDVEDLLWELSVELPVVHDPEQAISRAFGAFALPTSVLLDRRHRPRWRALGVVDWETPANQRLLNSLFR